VKRLRRRYLILELGEGEREGLPERLGSLPYRSELKLIPLGPRLLLLRCNHLQVGEVRSSLEAGGGRILGVSGTIRGAKRILLRRGTPLPSSKGGKTITLGGEDFGRVKYKPAPQ
jgi:hypothetical protein